jgi:ArsR family transcriptional regulator
MPVVAIDRCVPIVRDALSSAEAAALERVFQALADRRRVTIVNILARAGEPVCVCDLQASLGLKQPLVSYHLRQLVEAGLIERERRGTYSYYRLAEGALEAMRALFAPAEGASA